MSDKPWEDYESGPWDDYKTDEVPSSGESVFNEKIPVGEMILRKVRAGALPYLGTRISAGTASLLNDKSFDENLAEQQLRDRSTSAQGPKIAGTALEMGTSMAGTAAASGLSWPLRILANAALGGMSAADSQDLGTKEGLMHTGVGFGIGGIIGSAAEGVNALSKPGLNAVKALESKTATPSELLADQTPLGGRAEFREAIQQDPTNILNMTKEGSEKVGNRLGERVRVFRDAHRGITNDVHKTDDLLQLADQVVANKPSQEKFADEIVNRLQVGDKSTAGLLDLSDDIDDAAQTYYNKVTVGSTGKMSNNQRQYYQQLIDLRNAVKSKVRSPESAYGKADAGYSKYSSTQKPVVETLENANEAFATNERELPNPKQENPPVSKLSLIHKAANALKIGPEAADNFTKAWMERSIDPMELMKMVAAGDQEIAPNVKPSAVLKLLAVAGTLAKQASPAISGTMSRAMTPSRQDLEEYLRRNR